jgi:hypothetical protein
MFLRFILTSLLALTTSQAAVLAGRKDSQLCTVTPADGDSSLLCGVYGYLNQQKVRTLQSPAAASATNITACAASCLDQQGCVSFGFTGPRTCQLFSTSLKSMGLTVTKSGSTLYYNARCWDKACTALPKTSSCVCTSTLTGALVESYCYFL